MSDPTPSSPIQAAAQAATASVETKVQAQASSVWHKIHDYVIKHWRIPVYLVAAFGLYSLILTMHTIGIF